MSVKHICRVCLSENIDMCSIFQYSGHVYNKIQLSEILMACASVEVTLNDGLPDEICLNCVDQVNQFYEFKTRCENSDAVLRKKLLNKEPFLTDSFSNNVYIKTEIDFDVQRDETNSPFEKICDSTEELQTFPCSFCNASFSKAYHLKKHLDMHALENSIECKECGKKFLKEIGLKRHQRIHKVNDVGLARKIKRKLKHKRVYKDGHPYECDLCLIRFTRTDHLVRHKRRKHSKLKSVEKIFTNSFINKQPKNELNSSTDDRSELVQNSLMELIQKQAEVQKNYTCNECSKTYVRQDLFENHMKTHSKTNRLSCHICTKTFKHLSNLLAHKRTHNDEKSFLCATCGKGFNQLVNLNRHMIRHSEIKDHGCTMCSKAFRTKCELVMHMRIHLGIRPYICDLCNASFRQHSALIKHKRIHTEERPYVCDICQRRFSRSHHVVRHKLTHTGEKPFSCKICDKSFTRNKTLFSHMRIHTGEKPYICDICGKSFRLSSTLKTHEKRIHSKKNEYVLEKLDLNFKQ